ncbi:hypothetical protein ABZX95_47555 [Streptomyces sp. NPDC004232]|uniref:hypothetical protein n=1 Tax=Streptomyces sp. NPDC004232 TaxID=3154454 RepID=UPI001DA745C9|nr:hypothetical protein [Streptomyces sp. tea 10]
MADVEASRLARGGCQPFPPYINEGTCKRRQYENCQKVLALADELATGTIDTGMAASDAALGLAALLGQRPFTPSGLRRTGDPG